MAKVGKKMAPLLLGLALLLPPAPAAAMSRDVRSVIVTGAYGALGGTAIGLVLYPVTHSARGVFIGTSVGLYLGIIAGLYHIHHRDDPMNPLAGAEPPAYARREQEALAAARPGGESPWAVAPARPDLEVRVWAF
jgi:hypothetical protein